MASEMKLPELGEGVLEGELVKWLVKEGDTFKQDQPLCEVMTDKATVEIPSHHSGRVVKLLAKEGTMMKVGAIIMSYESAGATASNNKPSKAPSQPTAMSASAATSIAPRGPTTLAKHQPAGPLAPIASGALATTNEWIPSSPAVRKKAMELGISLSQVRATGPHGRVLMEDLVNYSKSNQRGFETIVSDAPKGRETRIPLKGMRRAIAKNLVKSKFTAPHFTYVDEVDVTRLVRLREQAKEIGKTKNVKVTFLPFIIKATIAALREFPMLNSSLDEESQEIILKNYYNIGIAAATEDGLIVPNVKDADRKSVFELAAEIAALSKAAGEGKSKLEDLKNGTFTISNIGSIGGLFATPIINHPEVGIMGVGKIVKRPMIKTLPNGDSKIVVRDMMYISLSLDHRIVDGAVGAQFSNLLVRYLERPELLVLN